MGISNKKFIKLDDGTYAHVAVPIVTASELASSDLKGFFKLANGLFAQAVVPIDENGDVQSGTPDIDESETSGNRMAFVLLDNGEYAQAVVLIDRNGNKL